MRVRLQSLTMRGKALRSGGVHTVQQWQPQAREEQASRSSMHTPHSPEGSAPPGWNDRPVSTSNSRIPEPEDIEEADTRRCRRCCCCDCGRRAFPCSFVRTTAGVIPSTTPTGLVPGLAVATAAGSWAGNEVAVESPI